LQLDAGRGSGGRGVSSYDCVVIGSGPGGYVAAIRAAQLGMKTAVVEKDRVGGRCLNYACIPAKAVLRSADVLGEIRDAAEFGLRVSEPELDFGAVAERRDRVIETLTGGVSGLLKKNAVDLIQGEASLASANEVTVDGDAISVATAIVLATGSAKKAIPGIAFSDRVIGTEEAWSLSELPARLAVVGAGASGTEIASAYARLGTHVTLFEALDRVLPAEDGDISRLADRAFKKQGIEVHTNTHVENVSDSGTGVTFTYGATPGEADYLVIAAGRHADVNALGLGEIGVKLTDNGLIEVAGTQRTTVPGLWAIGDLTPGPALAHKASDEGVTAVEDAAGLQTHPISKQDIPRATFCAPNVASFGLTEQQAKGAGYDVVVGKLQYGSVGAGVVYGDRSGLVKVVGERRFGELLGGHIIGARATELIQELVNLRALEGGYAELARIVHGHPTFSEAVVEAARAADGWVIHG
jgi:dihydrolipoamide dehydrogenase